MDQGLVAPDTGRKENNKHWFQIDPQLVNEIWSAFYPGMTAKAAERALWGARITNDDWGTHPTIAYGVMISAAFFEPDVNRLVAMAVEAVPDEGPFAEGIREVVRWHSQHEDWRDTRKRIHDKYYAYRKGTYEAPVSVVSSLVNGLTGVMAVLYGEGDYMKTVGIATSAGYDCDNQAATTGGLIGVLNGLSGMGGASAPAHAGASRVDNVGQAVQRPIRQHHPGRSAAPDADRRDCRQNRGGRQEGDPRSGRPDGSAEWRGGLRRSERPVG